MQLIKVVERIIEIGTNNPEYTVGTLAPLLPFCIALYRRHYFTKSSHYLFYFMIFFFLSDLPLWITTAMNIHNMLYQAIRNNLIITILLGVYFIGIKKTRDRNILFVYIGIMIFGIVLQLFRTIDKDAYIWVYCLLLGSISIWYFVKLMEYPKIKDLLIYPFFWFNSGVLFYAFSRLLIFFYSGFTIDEQTSKETYFLFNSILEYLSSIMFVMFAVGYWNIKRNSIKIN